MHQAQILKSDWLINSNVVSITLSVLSPTKYSCEILIRCTFAVSFGLLSGNGCQCVMHPWLGIIALSDVEYSDTVHGL